MVGPRPVFEQVAEAPPESHPLLRLRGSQLKQLCEIFTRFDMDGDGSLTQLELAALLRSLGLRPTDEESRALLAAMDSNGNGLVEFDELAAAIAPQLTTQMHLVDQAQLLEVFRAFDRDGNGFISAAELARSMARLRQPLTFEELTLHAHDQQSGTASDWRGGAHRVELLRLPKISDLVDSATSFLCAAVEAKSRRRRCTSP